MPLRPRSVRWLPLITLVLASGCNDASHPTGPNWLRPQPRPNEPWWIDRHNRAVARAQAGQVDLVFLGDSISHGWEGRGRDIYDGDGHEVWNDYYAHRNPLNLGFGSDRIEHALWRVEHGELSGISPRVLVLLIGTNNLDAQSPDEIAQGVNQMLLAIRRRLPKTHIVLLGLFPRAPDRNLNRDRAPSDPRVKAVNERLARLDAIPMVVYLNPGATLVESEGVLSKSVLPDFLHLSAEGYRRWAEAMEPTLSLLLGD